MKTLRTFSLGFIFCLSLTFASHAIAGVASFKTALISAVQANFPALERSRITNAFVAAYQGEWDARVKAGTLDNATNRADFTADKVIAFIQGTVQAKENEAAVKAVASPTPLSQ